MTHRRPTDHLSRSSARGLRQALREDPRVFLMGEDVGRYGGASP